MVLPAPFGPVTSTISPGGDVEIDARERGEAAEQADQRAQTNDEGHTEPPRPHRVGRIEPSKVYGGPGENGRTLHRTPLRRAATVAGCAAPSTPSGGSSSRSGS